MKRYSNILRSLFVVIAMLSSFTFHAQVVVEESEDSLIKHQMVTYTPTAIKHIPTTITKQNSVSDGVPFIEKKTNNPHYVTPVGINILKTSNHPDYIISNSEINTIISSIKISIKQNKANPAYLTQLKKQLISAKERRSTIRKSQK